MSENYDEMTTRDVRRRFATDKVVISSIIVGCIVIVFALKAEINPIQESAGMMYITEKYGTAITLIIFAMTMPAIIIGYIVLYVFGMFVKNHVFKVVYPIHIYIVVTIFAQTIIYYYVGRILRFIINKKRVHRSSHK